MEAGVISATWSLKSRDRMGRMKLVQLKVEGIPKGRSVDHGIDDIEGDYCYCCASLLSSLNAPDEC